MLLFCKPASLPFCLSACLFTCLSVCLPALPICLSACMSACLSACLSASLSVSLPACLPACLSFFRPGCQPACLPVWLPACLFICLPVCLPASLRCFIWLIWCNRASEWESKKRSRSEMDEKGGVERAWREGGKGSGLGDKEKSMEASLGRLVSLFANNGRNANVFDQTNSSCRLSPSLSLPPCLSLSLSLSLFLCFFLSFFLSISLPLTTSLLLPLFSLIRFLSVCLATYAHSVRKCVFVYVYVCVCVCVCVPLQMPLWHCTCHSLSVSFSLPFLLSFEVVFSAFSRFRFVCVNLLVSVCLPVCVWVWLSSLINNYI